MRFGSNPFRSAVPYTPKEVTVAVLVYIPHLTGYFEQKFEILKLSLASILKHTDVSHDLLLFDNGSCPEVINYLLNLRANGIAQYVILSQNNLGCLGAFNLIASAAPGRYVAYSDDDMLFRPHWLSAQLQILKTFPQVGMVSGLPTWQNFSRFTASTLNLAASEPSIAVERSKGWQPDWVKEYCESTGRNIDQFVRRCKDIDVVKLTRDGVSAFATCTHCQFLVSKPSVSPLLPLDTAGKAMYMDFLDERVDKSGFMRLSTPRPYVLHMGNRLSPHLRQIVSKYELEVAFPKLHQNISPPGPVAWLLKRASGRALLHKVYAKTFEWVSSDVR
jgi:GT2 family glycosyltransferase